ncbi:hypothetical protein BDP81DRAFT_290625, partial [Colletotrichum phormii]
LRRRGLNALKEPNYVAVSWTWGISEPYEDSAAGHHLLKVSKGELKPSGVRNRVFDRIRRYTEAQPRLQYVWIDMHCICQEPGPEKTRGMQAMDMVYKLSNHPIALLARPIESREELCLLADILHGNFVSKQASGDFRLKSMTQGALDRLREALSLLNAITSDLWWTRAWTFQENYRCDGKMTLLISHPKDDKIFREKRKNREIFGKVIGDLSISSRKFQTESTKMCQACIITEREYGVSGLSDVAERILKTAPNYEFLLRETMPDGQYLARWSQSPRTIKDIESRGSKFCHDRLAIVANCCQYSIRLDDAILRQGSHSMSLSMLALYLLNGEIMANACEEKDDRLLVRCRSQTVADFIADQSFDGFCPPLLRRPLIYNNGCRFIDVRLTEEGLKTSGHIWRLYRTIPTEQFAFSTPINRSQHSQWRRRRHTMERLAELRDALDELGYESLVQKLTRFLDADMRPKEKESFSQKYMWTMARMVVAAMDAHKPLVLGGLLDHQHFQYTGIFVGELHEHVYIFTSSKPMIESSGTLYPNDIDKHVSIEVHGDNLRPKDFSPESVPKLLIKRWVHGLCFFQKHSRRSVVFPWHPALK